ncbi:hypothetical protein [Xanthomonas cerealis]|uniref:hypothetical protein n=1 Tax=Xanthomonas cerealis TaxID=3390025 RepID=UPI0005795105|nr:hypothetical protein [Xanthomonas translucens]UKE46256.1 hypothetical protein KHA79_14140 [Xanthomonas translucens pv. cerealis]
MRKIFNKLLNIAIFGLAIFALDKVPERLDRMTHTAQNLAQNLGYSGPMAGIPSGVPDDIEW